MDLRVDYLANTMITELYPDKENEHGNGKSRNGNAFVR